MFLIDLINSMLVLRLKALLLFY